MSKAHAASIELGITLVGQEKKLNKKICISFSGEDWNALERFVREADKLRATRFAQEGLGGSIAIKFNHKSGVSSKAKAIDDEAFSTLILKARPFLLGNENTNFFRIWKMLSKYLHTYEVFFDHLQEIKAYFQLSRMSKLPKFYNLGEIPDSHQDVMDWLNAYEYHRDEEKRVKIEKKLGLFGTDQNGAPVIAFAITEMVQAIFHLSDFIENLLESKKGEFPITCPDKYIA